ncbi:MAG TPA: hypothetical protein VKB57_22880 [Acidimicrobiales bacterium]|nr:hypothetical protein [Acidimicrobiales bacterium]
MSYRLTEYGVGGPFTYPSTYPTVEAALRAAEVLLSGLADHPQRRPLRVAVIDAWTRQPVAAVTPEHGPDPFDEP